jgi:hypothetical protein
VCLLYLIGRCDGWGCSYSHARDELDWTDDEVKGLVHGHLQLIDAYNGRIARNPASFHLFPFLASNPVSWNQPAPPQPYPTPGSSAAIDPASVESEPLGDPHLGQQPSWNAEELEITANDSPEHAPAISPDPASDLNSEELVNAEDTPRETLEMKAPPTVSLNPFAMPFVPSGYKPVPTDEPPVITPVLEYEITPSPIEFEICRSPATDVVSTVTIQDHGGEFETPAWSWDTPEVSKVATKDDIDTWGAAPDAGLSWDDTPADDWASPTGGGGWDEGPSEDAFKTPPRTTISPTAARKARETFKGKEKPPTTSWRDRKPSESQSTSGSQKGKSGTKNSAKFEKFSARQHERRQSTPTITPAKKDVKRRSLVTIHNETIATTPFTEPWREGPPHKTPEVEDEEQAKLYEIKPQLGCIIPPKELVTEIAKAHLQHAREKPQTLENTQVTEENSPVDLGINWVNCGPSRLAGKADPPREFSQRSRPTGSTWERTTGGQS